MICMATDMLVCMGSSLRVQSSSRFLAMSKVSGSKIVIIHETPTPCDQFSDLVIRGKPGKVIEMIMQKLQIPIPKFQHSARLSVCLVNDDQKLLFTGID